MRGISVLSLLSALAAALPVTAVRAQVTSTTTAATPAPSPMPRPANDSLFRRARRLVLDGNGPAGRALVDSLLAAAPPGTSAYGDALYWHGALAPTLAEAERDYRRVIVEYPLAFYADDALLAIAELEQGRGDRAGALAHLERFVKEHPASPARGIAALGAARLAFEQNDTKVACAMIAEARASVAPGDVELNNQVNYYRSRCPAAPPAEVATMGTIPSRRAAAADTVSATKRGVPRAVPDSLPATPVTAAVVRADTTPAPLPAPAPVVVRPETHKTPRPESHAAPSHAAPSHGRYTIQLAAYNTRPDAEKFAAGLVKRGLPARVSGQEKPFRVRLGYYPSWGAAAREVAALKARGIVSFVAEEQ